MTENHIPYREVPNEPAENGGFFQIDQMDQIESQLDQIRNMLASPSATKGKELLKIAWRMFDRADYQRALEYAHEAADHWPEAEAFVLAGLAADRVGLRPTAQEFMSDALLHEPSDNLRIACVVTLGRFAAEDGDFDRAADYFTEWSVYEECGDAYYHVALYKTLAFRSQFPCVCDNQPPPPCTIGAAHSKRRCWLADSSPDRTPWQERRADRSEGRYRDS